MRNLRRANVLRACIRCLKDVKHRPSGGPPFGHNCPHGEWCKRRSPRAALNSCTACRDERPERLRAARRRRGFPE